MSTCRQAEEIPGDADDDVIAQVEFCKLINDGVVPISGNRDYDVSGEFQHFGN